MKKYLLITFSLIVGLISAQLPTGTYKDYFREGSFLTLEENYDLALKNFVRAYELDSSSANINYNLGVCYLKSYSQKIKAEAYLEKAVKNVVKTYKMDDPSEKAAPPLAFFYYAQSLHINYKFDEAIAQYDKFATFVVDDKDWKKDLAYYRKQSEYAKELVMVPMNVQITNLGDSVNSEYPDFSPVLSADERTLIFTTRRPTSTGAEKTPDGQFFEDIVVCYKDDEGRWSKPVPLSEFVNTNGHEASINLTPDGQTLIVYKDDGGNGNIYFSQWDGKTWSSLQQFGSDINTKSWESHACLTSDGNTLYFVSDRPGGRGGKDIYRCVKLPNGKWSKALNVGPTVNTEYDEDGAFIHPDGRSFFFASKGWKSMGGFDLMFSILDDENKFSEPINLGVPINTPDDDVFLVVSPDGKRSYYSSAKEGGYGDKDIYVISIPGAAEKPLALFKGQIVPADGEKLPDDLMIVVKDKTTGEIVGSYRPKLANGTFSAILPPGKEYNFSYQSKGEEFYNEDIYVTNDLTYQEIKKEISLEPVTLLGKVKVKNKGIILNVVVLNNPKDKKAVPNAKITLTEKGGQVQTLDADEHGKKDGTVLAADKSYDILAEAGGKKSVVSDFNTNGVKNSKTITEVIYLDGKTKASLYSLSLNVIVQTNAKSKKPVANANVVLVGNDGSKYEAQTDEKGQIKSIDVESDVNYDLSATKDDVTSEKIYFTTNNTKANKVYNKVLYMESATVAKLPPSKYEFYFKYNMNKIDEAEYIWVNFIDRVVALSKTKTVSININASASKVPSIKLFKNNNELAATRAQITADKIKAAVTAKGGDAAKLKFNKVSSVNGPPWKHDQDIRRTVFEKYQYVKVSAN